MAEKDIIARLKIEGQSEFIAGMTDAVKSTDKLDQSIDNTTTSLNEYQKSVTDASKSGKGLGDSINSANKSLDTLQNELTSTDDSLKKVIKDLLVSGKSAKEVGNILEQSVSKAANTASTSIIGLTSATFKNSETFRTFINEAKEGKATIDKSAEGYLKANGEMAKFANTTTDLKDKTISAKKELRQLTDDINSGRLSGEPLKLAISRAAELTDRIGDNREAIKNLSSDTRGIDTFVEGVTAIATGFQIAQGAAVLLGEDNEDLQKTFIKLNAIMAIANGLQQLHALTLQNSSLALKLNVIGQRAYALAVGTSTGAMKGFRLALAATGLGLVLIAIIAIAANWDKFSAAVVKSVPALGKFGETWNTLKATTRGFFSATIESFKFLANSTVAFGRLLKEVFTLGPQKAYQNFVADIGSGVKEINNAYKEGVEISKANSAEQKRIADTTKLISSLENQVLKAKAQGAKESTVTALELRKANAELSLLDKGSKEYYEKQIEINDLLKSTTKEVKKQKEEIKAQVGSLEELQAKYSALVKIINTSVPGSKAYNDAIEKAKVLGVQIEDLQKKIDASLKGAEDLASSLSKQFEGIGQQAKGADGSIADLEAQLSAVNQAINEGNLEDSVLFGLTVLAVDLESKVESAKKKIQELKDEVSGKIDIADYAEGALLNIENEERLREQQGLTYEDKVKKLKDLEAIEIGQAKNKGAEIFAIEEFYSNERNRLLEEEQQKRRDSIASDIQDIQSYGNIAFDVFKSFTNAKQALLDNQLKQGLISQEKYDKETAKLREKQAKADKLQAVFNAGLSGAVAILAAYAKGIVAGVIMSALVAAQIAAIVATPIPKFFKGVIGLKRGANPSGRDTIPAMLNEGESVMTTKETNEHKPVLEAIRKGVFDKNYMKRNDIKRTRIGSILEIGKQNNINNNKNIERKLNDIEALMEEIALNTGMSVGNGNDLYSLMKRKPNGNKHFV